MSQKLADFMVSLAVDPAAAQRFRDNPQAELTGAGLSDSEMAAVLSGDSDQVRSALGRSYADHLTQQSNGSMTKHGPRKPSRKKPSRKKGSGGKKKGARKAGKKRA